MNNVINEQDKIELSSYWAYQDFSKRKYLSVNGKKFKVIDEFHANNSFNQNGSNNALIFELYDHRVEWGINND